MFKLRIVNVDMHGYNGRDYHPEKSDEGLVVVPLGMSGYHLNPDTGLQSDLLEGGRCASAANALDQDNHEICWTCVTEDGRTLELMDFEVEIMDAAHSFVREVAEETHSTGNAKDDQMQLNILRDKAEIILGPTVLPVTLEASQIGLTPGHWPSIIVYHGTVYRRGKRFPIDGELQSYEYRDEHGRRLEVLND